ncbi:DEAD/DEAH box helicase [Boudabousia marimammalium]|uniref:DEAD/DEAH box helicase n=1 Tax=Boudabousia marimammalium TaxID=156892 RepID=A0A1Q5PPB5_9ACTO|nr:DEAD/DEAH box helicase [Boudabousia marimammalium]OKL49366.1 DEAD/DEAH box helicase [Boudabousia marimammalium]
MTTEPALNLLLDELEDQGKLDDATAVYDAFENWAAQTGRPLYPHQAEAALEIFSSQHVIAATPTGSGKSMIALAAHLHALAQGERSYYTAPLKALVSEKFFDLVTLFGASNVGMITGDISLNSEAPIICCTAEILANQSLREGKDLDVGNVVMDEFHYYSDPQRGWAWQVPLLEIPHAQMILMSATLGDVTFFVKDLEARSGRKVAVITGAQRPVPLEMEYSTEATDALLERLIGQGKYPVYLVHFSQKDAVSAARALVSANLIDKAARERVAEELKDVKFGPGFGKILSTLLRHGIGVHHAGMLPRYRRLVERLAQAGVLAVISGTDTLGVGINVPIRTVVMTALTKFDGSAERHLSAREFHQIAGRAGRAGFDTIGYVEVQAPPHVIENAKALAKAQGDAKKIKKITRKAAPEGRVNWTESTFDRLREAQPEPLASNFSFTHSMFLSVLERAGDPEEHLLWLARNNHDPETSRNLHLRRLGQIYQSLLTGEVIEYVSVAQAEDEGTPRLRMRGEMQAQFALNQSLSPFALAALDLLNPEDPDYALDVISIIEATLDDPRPLLYAQQRKEKDRAVASMKAEGLDYEARMEALEDVTWPQPLADLLEPAFEMFAQTNPWVQDLRPSPKSVVRFMVENAMTFTELISRFDIAMAEGVLLRYLTDAYRALRQVLPPEVKTEEIESIIDWLGKLVRAVDASLLDEWEQLNAVSGNASGNEESAARNRIESAVELPFGADENGQIPFSRNPHAARTAVRNRVFQIVELMAQDNVERLARLGLTGWDEDRWDHVLERYWAEYDSIATDQAARAGELISFNLSPTEEDLDLIPEAPSQIDLPKRAMLVEQVIDDPAEEHAWALWALVDLDASDEANAPRFNLLSVAPR